MDPDTLSFYEKNAETAFTGYESIPSPLASYFPMAFASCQRILDVGAGSGRDMAALLAMGCDVLGLEPSALLRDLALRNHPELTGRILEESLPFDGVKTPGVFDGILCSAVFMHIPREHQFDAAFSLKRCLRPGGRLLISVPIDRPGLDSDHRDSSGRLFEPLPAGYLQLLFERIGFRRISCWTNEDQLGREGYCWLTLLLALQDVSVRPIDRIEGVLNRDKKSATYKLALFRALAEIAIQQPNLARWMPGGKVGVPLDLVAEKWVEYYWPLFAHREFIPQNRGEGQKGKPPQFRTALEGLISEYRDEGGLARYILDRRSGAFQGKFRQLSGELHRKVVRAILQGPVVHAGLETEAGPVFSFEKAGRLIVMPEGIWQELCLMGHWILDSLILRWAELTVEMPRCESGLGTVLKLLLENPLAERGVLEARRIYKAIPEKRCVWSERELTDDFHVDHVIPFSLWRNNDLWNLLPAHPSVNNQKKDRLPERSLLERRKDLIVYYWDHLRNSEGTRFQREAGLFIGQVGQETESLMKADWQNRLFARLVESVEITALQRGIPRWAPKK
jgi:SAM-dependent methyltransferase